jgi:transcriptional regulator with XRE-family HTH domain
VLNKPILIDNISELLSKLRIAANLSQHEMADKLGWEQSNLSRFENENYNSQTISKIVEYVSALGVWLHITPSLTEEIKPENKMVKLRNSKPIYSDTATTLFPLSSEDASDSLSSNYFMFKPKESDTISI